MTKAEYKDRQYQVRSYDPAWTKQFKAEARTIKDIFKKDAITIEHIGSTAVPGMTGKPTLDILVCVNDLSVADRHADQMKAIGYEHLAVYVSPDSVLFRRMQRNVILSNVHIFPKDHPHVLEMIALRDYLRCHPEEANAYSGVKKELYEKYPNDYAAYRESKDDYMAKLKQRTKAERSQQDLHTQ